jgi:hypothetical protein
MVPVSPQSLTEQEKGLFGWISGSKLMSKVKVIKWCHKYSTTHHVQQ